MQLLTVNINNEDIMNQLPESLNKYDHHVMGDAIYFPAISNHDYHNSAGISSTTIRKFGVSELHAIKEEMEHTPALRFGSAAHSYIVEGEQAFLNEVAIISGSMYSAANKETVAECAEKGITCISPKDFETIKAMKENMIPYGDKLLHPTENEYPSHDFTYPYERALFWYEDDILCKLKADVVRHPDTPMHDPKDVIVVDYKTTKSCNPDSFLTSVRQYGYHYQAAWYTRGFEKAGFNVKEFIFVAQEKKSPYATKVFKIDTGDLEKYWIELEYTLANYGKYKNGLVEDLQTYNCPNVIELDL
tara:strand:+ start:3134 stop:4042 length:909 start_codon:yes stop_codon:yes gene_type:complete